MRSTGIICKIIYLSCVVIRFVKYCLNYAFEMKFCFVNGAMLEMNIIQIQQVQEENEINKTNAYSA